MPLKPFKYLLPETRFLHAGRLVYKFKIRYGSFKSASELDNTESAVKELEEAIRVILGNLDDLHPFSTDHFTVFPYLRKWERVSKMRFKHKNVHLSPYPYICIMYLEFNSFQQNLSFGSFHFFKNSICSHCHQRLTFIGKEVHGDSYELVKRRNEMSESTEMEGTVKKRRVEGQAETSYPKSCINREAESFSTGKLLYCNVPGAESVHHIIKAKHGFEMNYSKEIQCELSPASLTMGCNQENLWESVEYNVEQSTETSQAEGEMQLLQQMEQIRNNRTGQSKRRGLSKFWRRAFQALGLNGTEDQSH